MASMLGGRSTGRRETMMALAIFVCCFGFHLWGVQVGWLSKNLPGVEYRQAQTALSAHFIKLEDNFSLAYPTPVLGKPWSIPMEFPLYQWTTVVVGRVTGLGLVKAGRAVSIGCFFLTLPAIYLLLARWRVAPAHRWLVLSLVVTCPLYIFYGRAFLIETMALMFSLWFWVAFERAVAGRSVPWLVLAAVAGSGAGLVKVTTFMIYLLPAAAWTVRWLWTRRAGGAWRRDVAWMSAAVLPALVAAWWWLRFADATKALNPMANFLTSESLMGFNLGTTTTRFAPELWTMKWRIVTEELTWMPALIACGVIAAVAGRHRWRQILGCAGVFIAALLIFPVLYAYHDYYYVANTLMLLLAMGWCVVALAESAVPRWVVLAAIVVITGGQAYRYLDHYYEAQRGISPGGDGLTSSLRALTRPDDVLVIAGQDWSSMIPYYAQRRSLMVPSYLEDDSARLDAAFAALRDENIGALVIQRMALDRPDLVRRCRKRGLAASPLYAFGDNVVFLPESRMAECLRILDESSFHGIEFMKDVVMPVPDIRDRWFEVAKQLPRVRRMFYAMTPEPVRAFSTFGPKLNEAERRPEFGAHPDTRLVFALPAGPHTLRTTVAFSTAAYGRELADNEATDGVELSLIALGPGDDRPVLHSRLVNPRLNAADRGIVPLRFDFSLERAGEVELFVGPGPRGSYTRDWVMLGRLRIDSGQRISILAQ